MLGFCRETLGFPSHAACGNLLGSSCTVQRSSPLVTAQVPRPRTRRNERKEPLAAQRPGSYSDRALRW